MKKISPLKKFLVWLVCFNCLEASSWATDFSTLTPPSSSTGMLSGAEYVSGNYPGAILIPVNLWGSVQKSGIHHIPSQTDLLTLISLAGGPTPDAEMNKVIIKRNSGKKEEVIYVNIEELVTQPGTRGPILEANDIVIFPREKPILSNNTMTMMSFVGGILGIILASVALSSQVKH